jgi:acetyltransferase
MSVRNLDSLFDPASVAVIGASTRPASVGATVWRNLTRGGFKGPLYAVNPKHASLDGRPCHARVADLPGAPELAVICTPPATVAGLVNELAAKGTRAAVVLSAGMTPAQKQDMLDAARPHLLRLLGPNCIGLLASHIGLNASFAHINAQPGELAFVSQSGALVTAMLDWADAQRIGFSHFVSLGEHADVDFGDMLDYLATDARTRAILLYVESIESPRKFMSAARAAARNKPVIVIKSGRSAQGQKAAASHTGALAGSDAVYDAAIARAGMLRVNSLQELFLAAETLARFRTNRSESLTILTNGGGAGVMAADAAAQVNVPLTELGASTLAQLDAVLPANWSHGNPVDIIGDAPVKRYGEALQILHNDPNGAAVLFIHAPTAIVPSAEIATALSALPQSTTAWLMGCWLGGHGVEAARQIFKGAGIADYPTPEEAVRAFSMLLNFHRNQAELMEAPPVLPVGTPAEAAPDKAAVKAIVRAALSSGREMLNEAEAKAVLEAYRIPVVATRVVPRGSRCSGGRGGRDRLPRGPENPLARDLAQIGSGWRGAGPGHGGGSARGRADHAGPHPAPAAPGPHRRVHRPGDGAARTCAGTHCRRDRRPGVRAHHPVWPGRNGGGGGRRPRGGPAATERAAGPRPGVAHPRGAPA